MPYFYIFLCLLLVACGGEGFSLAGDATLDVHAGGAAGGVDGSDSGTAGTTTATTGGTQSGAGAGSGSGGTNANPTGGSAGAGGTEPVWIPDAECGPPLVDYSQLPTHFLWESYEQTSGGLCMWCGNTPCLGFDVEWDTTYVEWDADTGNPDFPNSLLIRTKSMTSTTGSDNLNLSAGPSCGGSSTAGCSCAVDFGDGLGINNLSLVRTATGYAAEQFTGTVLLCSPSCSGEPSTDLTILSEDAHKTKLETLSGYFLSLEFPCSGN